MDYHKFFLSSVGNRDNVFKYVLNLFENKPINVLEIGCLRDLSPEARRGDGWSSMHFANYILNNGGKIKICDISETSLNNCKAALSSLDIDKTFLLKDGFGVIGESDEKYDLVFIDGSDNPTETYEQYLEIKDRAQFILVDDFHTKGRLLKQMGFEHILFTWPNNPHELALFGNGSWTMEMELIE